ncbi:hypothetical protein Tco_0643215 [Tanacetum coccineum]
MISQNTTNSPSGESLIGAKSRRQIYAYCNLNVNSSDRSTQQRHYAVTKVEIVEWQNYKHLDWILVRRDDDVLYKFKELTPQTKDPDIEDMLHLLVQGKVTNLNVEEKRIALDVSLRNVHKKKRCHPEACGKIIQLDVESYQKKLNLTKPTLYRSNPEKTNAYTHNSRSQEDSLREYKTRRTD